MKKFSVLIVMISVIILAGFTVTACSRTNQSSGSGSDIVPQPSVDENITAVSPAGGLAESSPTIAIAPSIKPGLYAMEWPITVSDNPIASVPPNDIGAAISYVNVNSGPEGNPILYTLLIDKGYYSKFLWQMESLVL